MSFLQSTSSIFQLLKGQSHESVGDLGLQFQSKLKFAFCYQSSFYYAHTGGRPASPRHNFLQGTTNSRRCQCNQLIPPCDFSRQHEEVGFGGVGGPR
jgi:hypothetical protein